MKKKIRKNNYKNDAVYEVTGSGMVETVEQIRTYQDGDVIRYYSYSIFPMDLIDGIPLFNSYGQKVYNNITKAKEQFI